MPETNENEQRTTFGSYLTALMRDRGFKSDEQLARRAMHIQEQFAPRVNVQRRTINNWRNDKTTPRDISDQQFKLVAAALKISEQELAKIEEFINDREELLDDVRQDNPSSETGSKNAYFTYASASFAVAVLALLAWFWFGKNSSIVFNDIPPTQLPISQSGFVLLESGNQVVSERQLEQLTGWELYVARNEIFARKGRPFVKQSSICLQNHFDSWEKSTGNPKG